jgi:hypothetical protein
MLSKKILCGMLIENETPRNFPLGIALLMCWILESRADSEVK